MSNRKTCRPPLPSHPAMIKRSRRPHTATVPTSNPAGAAAARILLVDDDPGVRDSLAQALVSEGYTVFSAAGAADARALQERETVELAILDLNLPDQSGWELFETLTRANPLLPVIILTGRSEQIFTALSAGVGALMEKPPDLPRLIEIVQELLAETGADRLDRLMGRRVAFRFVSGSESAPNPRWFTT